MQKELQNRCNLLYYLSYESTFNSNNNPSWNSHSSSSHHSSSSRPVPVDHRPYLIRVHIHQSNQQYHSSNHHRLLCWADLLLLQHMDLARCRWRYSQTSSVLHVSPTMIPSCRYSKNMRQVVDSRSSIVSSLLPISIKMQNEMQSQPSVVQNWEDIWTTRSDSMLWKRKKQEKQQLMRIV